MGRGRRCHRATGRSAASRCRRRAATLFNAVLAARVARGDWDRLLPGEAVMLDGRRSFFIANPRTRHSRRVASRWTCTRAAPCRVAANHPRRASRAKSRTGRCAPHAALVALLASERIDHERRSLRLPVREFDWSFGDDDTLVLRFVLPRGTFATAVLHEVLADAWDAGEGGEE